jgi:hypothetical protein
LVSKYFSSEKLCDWITIEPVSKLEDTDKASDLKSFHLKLLLQFKAMEIMP